MDDVRYRHSTTRVTHDVLDGEVLVIDEPTGAYFSMSGTAAAVWVAIGAGRSIGDVTDTVAHHLGVSRGEIAHEVTEFVDRLVEHGLVEVTVESGVAPPMEVVPVVGWAPPDIDEYTDMRDLLMFDPIHEVDTSGWPNVER